MPAAKGVVIQPLGFDAPVARAAAELAKYLPQLAPVRAVVRSPRAV